MTDNAPRKKKKRPAKITRVMCALLNIIGVCAVAYYILLIPYLGFGVSFALVWPTLGAACLLVSLLIRRMPRKRRRLQTRLSALLACLMGLCAAVFLIIGVQIYAASAAVPPDNAPYMLVLGARVKPEGASVLLEFRMDKAAEYLLMNKDTTAILCGGQGSNEPMSEAQCMYDGLIERGIAADRLIMEDQSTSTRENILNAMALMSDTTGPVVITTTGYHVYRALNTARSLGLTDVHGNAARCAWITPLNYYTREALAVIRDWLSALIH